MKIRPWILSAVFVFFCFQGFSAGWVPAIVVDIEGDTLKGEIKAGKRTFSDFIKFRDEQGRKQMINPEFFPEVITSETHFKSIWFDDEVAGYNTYCYGKLLTFGCIEIYDVIYPFRSCACKTQGTRKSNWVIKLDDEPLFIIQHNFFNEEIQNIMEVQSFLKRHSDLSKTVLKEIISRESFLNIISRYNEACRSGNRTYQSRANFEIDMF
ncbi:MAG: hypothetical protein PF448_09240 [Bacteroidales bacterium]|jgi:hypothetical protein|nr:hypothetical protein [Bacteroidales bacterium]